MTGEKIAIVEWIDAFGCPAGWEFEEEALLRATTVRSVGHVLNETDEFVMLEPHISNSGDGGRRQLAGHIAIPRRQIVAIKVILPSSCDLEPASEQNQQRFSAAA